MASPEALSTHSRGATLAAMNPQLAGKVAGRPEVIVLQAVPAGDPPKGPAAMITTVQARQSQ